MKGFPNKKKKKFHNQAQMRKNSLNSFEELFVLFQSSAYLK